jgi:ketosteroid isomerase-like protein
MGAPMANDEDAVLAANAAFYDAFARRDLAAMDGLWTRSGPVCCIHPGWGGLHDRDAVLASWASIFAGDEEPAIRCVSPRVRIDGDAATVICEEVLGEARLVATNVFVREGEEWRLWHHHAGPVARRVARRREGPLLN